MIRFEDVEIKFGDFVAIQNLNLEIEKGEFFTFLGPSGCGKTTTLRALVGFIHPSKGRIWVNDEDITDKQIEKRGIGMVFQSYALFPTMTVRENIEFGLKENKWKVNAIAKRVEEVASIVNLNEEQLQKNVSELSGGQQQRVAIARALALRPDIIVLDEPLSNLDAKLRKSLRLELKKIQQMSGATMIYVTHDQEEALTLSSRIAVFNNGFVEQVGTPREIYYHPASEFVTNFIGDTNMLPVELLKHLIRTYPDLDLSDQDHVYVRAESIKDQIKEEEKEAYLELPAIVSLEEFYGITTRRTYNVAGVELRSINTKVDQEVNIGDQKTLYINRRNLIVFKG